MSWQRARQPEHKDIRRAAIIDAARALLEAPPHDPSLRTIASHAKLSASSIYRYFSCREAIFMAVLSEDFDAMIEQMREALDALPPETCVEEIVSATIDVTLDHDRLLRLMAQRPLFLESASTAEEITAFRLSAKRASDLIRPSLTRLLPTIHDTLLRSVQLQLFTLIAATWHLRSPTQAALEAMQHPDLANSTVDYAENLKTTLAMLVHGAIHLSDTRDIDNPHDHT